VKLTYPSSSEFKNACSHNSAPQYVFMEWCLVKHRDNFNFLPSLLSTNSISLFIRISFMFLSSEFLPFCNVSGRNASCVMISLTHFTWLSTLFDHRICYVPYFREADDAGRVCSGYCVAFCVTELDISNLHHVLSCLTEAGVRRECNQQDVFIQDMPHIFTGHLFINVF
jgi:hypothetical protein